jgi:trypsin
MNLSKALLLSQLFTFVSAASLRGSNDGRDLLIQPQPRIINGNRTPEGRYSYAVSLKDDVGHFCGGSLIAPDVVLSAAHCAGGDYKAIIGRHSLQDTDGEEMIVKTEMMHPSYDSSTTDNDFVLIFLESSVTLDVDLVTVSPDVVAAGTDVTVMGWGDTDKAEDVKTLATELLEVEVTTMTNEECALSKSTEVGWEFDYSGQITDNMMCAENVADKDSCQGDSGGPLVIRQESGDDLQVGVVSWGIGCAHNDFPGVYARISAQYDWIQKNVCEGSAAPPSSFDCGSIISTTRTVDTASLGGFTQIVQEEFGTGFGLFNQHGNDASHYLAAKNRNGVVRIQNGANGISTLKSNQISLENNPFTKFKVDFSFYAIEMEHSDDFCVSYEINDGVETGEKCWSSLHSFQNHVWNNDKSFEFGTALDAHNLRLTFQVKGDDDTDDVLLDSVTVYGQA